MKPVSTIRDERQVSPWRRFNRNDWMLENYGRPWTELLPENERLTINGETFVHWYDCITDYIL